MNKFHVIFVAHLLILILIIPSIRCGTDECLLAKSSIKRRNTNLDKIQEKVVQEGYEAENVFIVEALEAHNKFRRLHGVPSLRHNFAISNIALDWAKVIAELDKMEHSKNKYKNASLGENIAVWRGPQPNAFNGANITKLWYDEISVYNFNKPDITQENAHFTQIIWKDTQEVGFGIAMSKSGKFYAVANYYPPGNIQSKIYQNVLPLIEHDYLNSLSTRPLYFNSSFLIAIFFLFK